MKELIDILHLLLCNKVHTYEMLEISNRNKSLCYYYLESDIAEGDTLEDHLVWRDNKESFKHLLNFSSDEEALNFIREVLLIIQQLKDLTSENPARLEFVNSII